jgi:hypothetical protein
VDRSAWWPRRHRRLRGARPKKLGGAPGVDGCLPGAEADGRSAWLRRRRWRARRVRRAGPHGRWARCSGSFASAAIAIAVMAPARKGGVPHHDEALPARWLFQLRTAAVRRAAGKGSRRASRCRSPGVGCSARCVTISRGFQGTASRGLLDASRPCFNVFCEPNRAGSEACNWGWEV